MAVQISPKDYEATPEGQARRWQAEFKAAKERLKEWHKQGDECVDRYLDERDGKLATERRLNLYSSGIQTRLAMLYGNTPDVAVERRFADAEDDPARVAAEIAERALNSDLERTGDNFQTAQALAGWDNQVPGLGAVWLRYEAEFEKTEPTEAIMGPDGMEQAPAVPSVERKSWEDVATDWVFWKDFLWNPCRVWHERRWVARKLEMPKEASFDKRFASLGTEKLKSVPTKSIRSKDDEESKRADPLAAVEVWEIWDRPTKKQIFYVEGFPEILEANDDPLGLEDFFPCPEPMVANPSTSKLVPRPDWVLYQDQYREIDQLTTRIGLLREAVRVTGAYDAGSPEIKGLLQNTTENKLIPVSQWAMFAEKGGIKGAVDFMPLADIVGALSVLRENRAELISDLYQVTGMSDIMRGQATASGTSATEQAIKARFGSVRMQAQQDRAARFATDTQRIRFEIMCKHFDPATILERSNCARSYDAALAQQAIELLKSRHADFRVSVKPESMSLTDFAALKAERMEILTGISTYLNVAGGIAAQMPGSVPGLLKILKFTVAGLKGADGLESIIDEMANQAEAAAAQAAANPQAAPPDPKVEAEKLKLQGIQMKGQQDLQKEQFKLSADLTKTQAELQADDQREQSQAHWNTQEATQKALVQHALRPVVPGPRNGNSGGFIK